MTWSFVLNDISQDIPEHLIEQQGLEHPQYPADIRLALKLARDAGIKSGAITGMRLPNPYNTDEVVDISIRGRMLSDDFVTDTTRDILAGPDHLHEWYPASDENWSWYQCQCGMIQPGSKHYLNQE